MKRKKPLARRAPLWRRTRIRPVSPKRRALLEERRRFVARYLAEHPTCEAGATIMRFEPEHRCQGRATDVHEVLTRARGGSIVDDENVLAVCRACHDHIHAHPRTAAEIGLLAWSWEASA